MGWLIRLQGTYSIVYTQIASTVCLKSEIFRVTKFSYNKFSSILIFVHMALDQWKC